MPKRRQPAEGGGAPAPICADLIARAIVAAAAVYGDSPVRALEAKRGLPKRCLPAALAGVHAATGVSLRRLGVILGCRRDVLARAQARGSLNPDFQRARRAAERAASYAQWRPEARESVVGGMGEDVVQPPPAERGPELVELAPKTRPAPAIAPRPAKLPHKAVPDPVEPRAKGHGMTEEDRSHVAAIVRVHGAGFPVLARG